MNTDNAETAAKDIVIAKSIRYSFFNGLFFNAMNGFLNNFLTPFLLLLGGTPLQVGMLNAFPDISSAMLHIKTPDIIDKFRSRKKPVVIFVFLEAFILLIIAVCAFLMIKSPYLLIIMVTLFSCAAAVANPAWGSWISHLVIKDRGIFFGRRSRVYGFIKIGATFLAGFLLTKAKAFNPYLGFALIFFIAFVLRFLGWAYLKRMYEPNISYEKESYFSIFDFLAQIKTSNYAKYVLFISLLGFSVNLATPFYAVLMLKDLHFSYMLYSVLIGTTTISRLLFIKRWGHIADHVGNIKIIKFTSVFIGILPLLWIVCRHPVYLIFVQIFSGFLWAGFHLCTTNFIYDAVTPEKRARCISYYRTLQGIAIFCGAMLGGIMVTRLPALIGYQILTLFLISAVLRVAVTLLTARGIKEVRPVHNANNLQIFFSMMFDYKTILGIDREPLKDI
ncbi:MFS transporter [Candidatus Auribacterota bacterium]